MRTRPPAVASLRAPPAFGAPAAKPPPTAPPRPRRSLYTQTLVLVARSLLSLRTARLGGEGLKAILNRSWRKFGETVFDFLLTGAAASIVNSSLKYLTNSITVAFRTRLTQFVHARYLANRAYCAWRPVGPNEQPPRPRPAPAIEG